jgi:hypothetical protein
VISLFSQHEFASAGQRLESRFGHRGIIELEWGRNEDEVFDL